MADSGLQGIRNQDLIDELKNVSRLQRVLNGGVEKGIGASPDYWSKGGDDQGALSWEAVGYRSSRSIRIDTLITERAQWESDHFPVRASTPYRFGLRIKGAADSEAFLTLRFFDDEAGTSFISEENIALDGSYSDWTVLEDVVESPALALSADLVLRVAEVQVNDFYGDDLYCCDELDYGVEINSRTAAFEKLVGVVQIKAVTEDLEQAAASYDLVTGTDQDVIVESLTLRCPVDCSDDAGAFTGISIQTDDTTPQVFVSQEDGVKANLTEQAQLSWASYGAAILLKATKKIQLTIYGDPADAPTVCDIVIKCRAVVSGGYLA